MAQMMARCSVLRSLRYCQFDTLEQITKQWISNFFFPNFQDVMCKISYFVQGVKCCDFVSRCKISGRGMFSTHWSLETLLREVLGTIWCMCWGSHRQNQSYQLYKVYLTSSIYTELMQGLWTSQYFILVFNSLAPGRSGRNSISTHHTE